MKGLVRRELLQVGVVGNRGRIRNERRYATTRQQWVFNLLTNLVAAYLGCSARSDGDASTSADAASYSDVLIHLDSLCLSLSLLAWGEYLITSTDFHERLMQPHPSSSAMNPAKDAHRNRELGSRGIHSP